MIYIIGAGWYGCHIALELLHKGYTVRIVDKANAFFNGSSARNQNRLHLGYHYPRSAETIAECRQGFAAFKAVYPTLSTPIPNNLYLIAGDSRVGVAEFSRQFDHPGELLCLEGRTPFSKIRGVRPTMFQVAEEYIDNAAAAAYFSQRLAPYFLHLSPNSFTSMEKVREVLEVGKLDWIINCTYNHLEPIAMDHYELFCSLIYHIPGEIFALTLMDGDYFSIYPYDLEKRLYTVTSVRHGVVWRGIPREEADAAWSVGKEKAVRKAVEADVVSVLPEFPTVASYRHCFLSWKTKPVTDEDDRSLRFVGDTDRRMICLYGGKITGIFEASRRVLEYMNEIDRNGCSTITPDLTVLSNVS